MASPIASTEATVILEKPSDWHDWLLLVRMKAIQLAVDEYIDPDLAIEPDLPTKPVRPSPADVMEAAVSIHTLDAEQMSIYRQLVDDYKIDLAEYTRISEGLGNTLYFIVSTTARQHFTFIEGLKTPYSMLSALKKRLAPTDRARELEVIGRCQEIKRATGATNLDKGKTLEPESSAGTKVK